MEKKYHEAVDIEQMKIDEELIDMQLEGKGKEGTGEPKNKKRLLNIQIEDHVLRKPGEAPDQSCCSIF